MLSPMTVMPFMLSPMVSHGFPDGSAVVTEVIGCAFCWSDMPGWTLNSPLPPSAVRVKVQKKGAESLRGFLFIPDIDAMLSRARAKLTGGQGSRCASGYATWLRSMRRHDHDFCLLRATGMPTLHPGLGILTEDAPESARFM